MKQGWGSHLHPGVLVAKVRYFGVKSAKVLLEQMGTKPAKVGHLAANLLKYVPNLLKYVPKKREKSAPARFDPGPIASGTERLTLKLIG